jgi:hypothetical protein
VKKLAMDLKALDSTLKTNSCIFIIVNQGKSKRKVIFADVFTERTGL